MIIIVVLAEIPFTLVRKIEKLKFMALLGVIGIFIFVITFVFYYAILLGDSDQNIPKFSDLRMFPGSALEALGAIPIIILALSYHMNFFPVFKGMKNSNDQRISRAALAGVATCATCYAIVGTLGYHLAGD